MPQRLQQTLGSLDSIRRYCAGSTTVLLETTLHGVDPDTRSLLQTHCDLYLEYGHDPMVEMLHTWAGDRVSLVKSPNEALILHRALREHPSVRAHDRIFKLSGRYQLTSGFDRRAHDHRGSLVMLRREPSMIYYSAYTNERFEPLTPWQYKTRLYSFCASLADTMSQIYQDVLMYLLDLYQQYRFNDIEHVLFAATQNIPTHELAVMGVAGMQAPNQQWIQE